jgi:hypothetical protein
MDLEQKKSYKISFESIDLFGRKGAMGSFDRNYLG